ncbi:MAG: YtxH domain-containing protein [Longimicrobiaceae bacterium]
MAYDDDDLPALVIETRGGSDVGTFLLGALVGAAAALLLAPRSGAETQAEIAGAARRLRDDMQGRVSGARERVGGRVSGTLESVRGGVETRVAQARAALDAGRGAARDAREELQRRVDEAKRSYRSGLSAVRGNGDGAAEEGDGAGEAGDVVVTEVVVEETTGELE